MATTESDKLTLKTRALRFLARREYSRRELQQKLSVHAQSPQLLADLLDQLERDGSLSAERFIEQTIQARRSRFGNQRIVHELREKGIDDHLIAHILPELKETELEAACQVWQKKFGILPGSTHERSKQIRFMIGRGFSTETVHQVLAQAKKTKGTL